MHILLFAILISATTTFGQIAINSSGTDSDPSAILDVVSTDKGMLIPRLTTAQRTGIVNAAEGLLVYDTDIDIFYYYRGSAWAPVGSGSKVSGWDFEGDTIKRVVDGNTLMTIAKEGNVGIGTAAPGAKLEVSGGNLKMTDGNIVLNSKWFSGDGDDEGVYVRGSNGHVGIGRVPNSGGNIARFLEIKDNLGIYGADSATLYLNRNATNYMKFNYFNNILHIEQEGANGGVKFRNEDDDDIFFIDFANERSTFPTGSVGIGTTSPDEKFEVEFGDSDKDVEIGVGTTDPDVTFITLRSPNGTKYYITVDGTGSLTTSSTKP